MDVARADTVDLELDRLISKRASQDRAPDPDENEEIWMASVRAHNDRIREANRQAWRDHHVGQAARLRIVLEALIARHDAEAARLSDEPKGA